MRDWKREVSSRLAGLEIAPARLAGIVEEVGQHLEERWTRLVAAGTPAEEADRLVLQDLSDSAVFGRAVKRLMRGSSDAPPLGVPRGGGWVGSLWQDVRYGI